MHALPSRDEPVRAHEGAARTRRRSSPAKGCCSVPRARSTCSSCASRSTRSSATRDLVVIDVARGLRPWRMASRQGREGRDRARRGCRRERRGRRPARARYDRRVSVDRMRGLLESAFPDAHRARRDRPDRRRRPLPGGRHGAVPRRACRSSSSTAGSTRRWPRRSQTAPSTSCGSRRRERRDATPTRSKR